jgi:hypothetical protein
VVLKDPSGKVLLSISLTGVGSGGLTGFVPGVISTFAGGGTSGDGGPASSALLAGPTSIAVDGFGNHYIADPKANKIRKVTAAGSISTFAGTGTAGYSGDGGPATGAQLNGPMAVLVDGAGFVYIADTSNNVIRLVTPDGNISTYAGQYYAPGTIPPPVCSAATNPVGDGCPGNQIVLNTPVDLVFCIIQNLHIADKLNNRVRTVMRTSYKTITQVGNGVGGYNGDGGLSTSSEINGPTSLAMDAANNIYVADSGNHVIRKTLLTGTTPNPISTVAGTPGSAGNIGDGGPAVNAQLNNPVGLRVDPAGDIYISDSSSQVVREVNAATGKISTIVGNGSAGGSGDGGPSVSAQVNGPYGLLLDEIGNLYIADTGNAAIRKVDVSDAPSLSFANTTVGATTAAQDVTVMNLGASALTISKITAVANYSLGGSDTSCSLSGSQSLNPGTSCVLGIEFIPTTAGTLNGSVVLTDDASPATHTIALTGIGGSAQPGTYTVAVNTPTVSMPAGGSGADTLTLKSTNYAGTVSFTTSVTSTNGTPADVTASATSVTVTAGGTATSTVTISANASAMNHTPFTPWNGGTALFCAGLFGMPFAFRRKRFLGALPMLLAVSLAGFLVACGAVGGSTNSQSQGSKSARTYTVTVTPTGTAGSGASAVTNPSAVTIQVTVQ